MKINDKIISIPPHISTTWDNVAALHMEGDILVISLLDGAHIDIPNLDEKVVKQLFDIHATIVEHEMEDQMQASAGNPFNLLGGMGDNFQLSLSGIDGLGAAMGHNSAQSDAPDLPPELLKKVAQLAKLVAPSDLEELPKPEPLCNCMHCQVARALRLEVSGEADEKESSTPAEDPVSDADLQFCQWNIEKKSENLYEVSSRLDPKESYQVHLADPVGCTCGQPNCEHLLAVLRS